MSRAFLFLVALANAAMPILAQQTAPLEVSADHPASRVETSPGFSPLVEIDAAVHLQLTQAEARSGGSVWLEVSADASAPTPARVTLRIPLSSTEDAYGESRSCKSVPGSTPQLTFTAGLDEKSFVRFAPAISSKDELNANLLLNKYLCRMLAAPFHCGNREIKLSPDWTHWRLARRTALVLSSGAPAALIASPVVIVDTHKPFDPTSCTVIAPSNGICCVAGKTTQWHCGGKPSGSGWHQVSGDCYHHETGGLCSE